MHNKYIITYECHDNAPRMWKVVQIIREIFWLLPVLSPLLPVVSHFSFVSTWKRSHFSLWFQSSGSPVSLSNISIKTNFKQIARVELKCVQYSEGDYILTRLIIVLLHRISYSAMIICLVHIWLQIPSYQVMTHIQTTLYFEVQ